MKNMLGERIISFIVFAFCTVSAAVLSDKSGNNQNYRIEVLFQRFENKRGLIFNGKRCDTFSRCDPHLSAYIDITSPFAKFPGNASKPADFETFAKENNRNILNLDRRILKDICVAQSQPKGVTVRVRAYDADRMTSSDLMEEFDCTFGFLPTHRDEVEWSVTDYCQPVYQRNGIRLSFRWRIFPIEVDKCPERASSFTPTVPLSTVDASVTTPQATNLPGVTTKESKTTWPASELERLVYMDYDTENPPLSDVN